MWWKPSAILVSRSSAVAPSLSKPASRSRVSGRRWKGPPMADVLDTSVLVRWQRQPLSFITEILRDPETAKPFVLLDAERAFLEHAYQTDASGRLVYPEQLYG